MIIGAVLDHGIVRNVECGLSKRMATNVPENWTEAEKIGIGLLSHCTLCQPSDQWLGKHALNTAISNGKIWNDKEIVYVPSTKELDWFFGTVRLAGEYVPNSTRGNSSDTMS